MSEWKKELKREEKRKKLKEEKLERKEEIEKFEEAENRIEKKRNKGNIVEKIEDNIFHKGGK